MTEPFGSDEVVVVEPARRRRIFGPKRLAMIAGVVLAGTATYAATNWVVGLGAGSSGEAQSGSISNLSITAAAAPGPANVLYPGGSGDVVATINNPNAFPVTVTAVDLPAMTTYAGGFTTSALTTPQPGCTIATSFVAWTFATATVGSAHTLTTALTVGPQVGSTPGTLVVTLTGAASMTTASLSSCANTFFSMAPLTGVAATGGTDAVTTSPATDGWTS